MIHLLVKSDGIYLIPEMPKKPKEPGPPFNDWAWMYYEKQIIFAKKFSIWVQDQAKSWLLLENKLGRTSCAEVGTIYPITGWRFEKPKCMCESASMQGRAMMCFICSPYKKEVAVLIEETNHPEKPESSENKPEKIIFGIMTTGMTAIDPLWKGSYKESSPTDEEYKKRLMAFLEEKKKETVEPEKPTTEIDDAADEYGFSNKFDIRELHHQLQLDGLLEQAFRDGANYGYSLAQSELTRFREEIKVLDNYYEDRNKRNQRAISEYFRQWEESNQEIKRLREENEQLKADVS